MTTCVNLQTLNLKRSSLIDDICLTANALPALKNLGIKSESLYFNSLITFLRACPNISTLDFEHVALVHELTSSIEPLNQLGSLRLFSVSFHASSFNKLLSACPNLKTLTATAMNLKDFNLPSNP